MSRESLLKALMSQYQGEMDVAMANINVYQNNPAGIGEHPDVVQALDTQVEKYANAKEKFEAVQDLLNNRPQKTLTE
jgi:hypothetical protein